MKAKWWALVMMAACVMPKLLYAQSESPPGICVLDPESKLIKEDRLRALGEGLRDVVGRFPDVRVLKGPALTNRLLRLRARCTNEKPACLAAMGRVARAGRVLFTRIGGSGGSCSVEMLLLDVGLGQIVGSYATEAPVAEAALGPELKRAWDSLHGPTAHGQIKISSNVTGAEIMLDGQAIGRTPLVLTKDLEPGEHRISARAGGFREHEERFSSKGNEGITLHLMLEQEEKPPAPAVAPTETKPAGGKEEDRPPAVTSARRPPLAGEGGTVVPPAATPVPVTAVEAVPVPRQQEQATTRRQPAIYERWWFWTAVGLLVSAATVGGLVYGLTAGEDIPSGTGRVTLDF